MKSTKKNSFRLGAWKLVLALGTALVLSGNSALAASAAEINDVKRRCKRSTPTRRERKIWGIIQWNGDDREIEDRLELNLDDDRG